MSRRAWIVLIWLALLAVSHVVRLVRPHEPAWPAGIRVMELPAVSGERQLDRRVRLAYRDAGPLDNPSGGPVLLLHGSPGSHADFDSLLAPLSRERRLVAPDLPGFGASEHDVPDYSIRAHARYALELLDRLGIEEVHVVGFSMGGGVALNLYDLAPQRVRSLTLLSAIGVQELELFGDYRLNHSVHAVQVAGLWLLRELLPHMGLLDGAFFGVPYARNFYDSDQRPLRSILQRFEPPVLIVHGNDDFLVPPEAAREHHRVVPHSRLEMLDASHFMVFKAGTPVAAPIARFLDRVESGTEPRLDAAAPDRVAASRVAFDPRRIPPFTGVALLVMMALIAAATLVSEDLTCIGVGLLAAQGRIEFLPGVVACCVGILVGDLLLFLAGRVLGRPALRRAPLKLLVSTEQVEIASRWFVKRGPIVIGLSRFMPGTRLPVYIASGVLRTSFWRFSFYFVLAVVAWTPLLVGMAMLLGERTLHLFESFERLALPALILVGVWVLVVVKWFLPLTTFRGRRRMVGRWGRLTHWEFWPPWVFYPPVVLYVVFWLGLRFRNPWLFTAANPALPGGGFIAESKTQILSGLAGADGFVARWIPVPADGGNDQRVDRVHRFMEQEGLDYPIVLKPDAGQRGSGVGVLRSDEALREYLSAARFDAIAQEHVPGEEFGIFYYRRPGEARGRIFSITEKKMPTLIGDGRRTVEQLILTDRRAVRMADHYLRAQAGRLFEVPAAGEALRLVELGTHCRGAIFLDGSRVASEALARSIDEISRTFDGFWFGRYDVRAPDVEELKRGRGFKVIELNGVTSEATHIYDPKLGLLNAYRTLFGQWRIAFEIGRANRDAGARPSSMFDLLRLIREYRRSSSSHPS